MKVFRITVAGALLLVAAAAAFGMSVKSDYEKSFDFSRLRTFGFKTDRVSNDPLSTNTIEADRIQNALSAQLSANGFSPSPDNPDFVVAFYSNKTEKTQVQSLGGGFGFARDSVGVTAFPVVGVGAGALVPTSGPPTTLKAASWPTLSTRETMKLFGAVL